MNVRENRERLPETREYGAPDDRSPEMKLHAPYRCLTRYNKAECGEMRRHVRAEKAKTPVRPGHVVCVGPCCALAARRGVAGPRARGPCTRRMPHTLHDTLAARGTGRVDGHAEGPATTPAGAVRGREDRPEHGQSPRAGTKRNGMRWQRHMLKQSYASSWCLALYTSFARRPRRFLPPRASPSFGASAKPPTV